MKRSIEADLPNNPGVYGEIRFVARASDAYDPAQTTEKLAQLLECLYNQIPNVVAQKLAKDPRAVNFRKMLEDRF